MRSDLNNEIAESQQSPTIWELEKKDLQNTNREIEMIALGISLREAQETQAYQAAMIIALQLQKKSQKDEIKALEKFYRSVQAQVIQKDSELKKQFNWITWQDLEIGKLKMISRVGKKESEELLSLYKRQNQKLLDIIMDLETRQKELEKQVAAQEIKTPRVSTRKQEKEEGIAEIIDSRDKVIADLQEALQCKTDALKNQVDENKKLHRELEALRTEKAGRRTSFPLAQAHQTKGETQSNPTPSKISKRDFEQRLSSTSAISERTQDSISISVLAGAGILMPPKPIVGAKPVTQIPFISTTTTPR